MNYPVNKPFIALTTTRNGGVSEGPYKSNNMSHIVGDRPLSVTHNRERTAQYLPIPLSNWVFVRQCHSDQIRKVTHEDKGKGAYSFNSGIEGVDALYTLEPNIMLAFMHADCVPVLLYDETSNMVAAIHAGWQGTLQEITQKSIQTILENETIDPQNIKVIIGPCLSFESCQLNPEAVPYPYELNKNIQLDENNHLKLNVSQMNIEQCLACGIPLENISRYDEDTFSHPEKYFSFQRDNITGRHLSAIGRVQSK